MLMARKMAAELLGTVLLVYFGVGVAIPITGTSVNPARSLGPALIVGGPALSQVWLFIVAPLVGGALAAGGHRLLNPRTPAEPLASGEIPPAGS